MGLISSICPNDEEPIQSKTKPKKTQIIENVPIYPKVEPYMAQSDAINNNNNSFGTYNSPNFMIQECEMEKESCPFSVPSTDPLLSSKQDEDNDALTISLLQGPQSPVKGRKISSKNTTTNESPMKLLHQNTLRDQSDLIYLQTPQMHTRLDMNHLSTSNIIETELNEDEMPDNAIPLINEKGNLDLFAGDYVSMKSKKFLAPLGKYTDHINYLSEVINKRQYLIFYLEFNYFNLMKWAKDYLAGIYPEINLIVLIELDDDVKTQQKIFLVSSDEKNKYLPMNKSQDATKKTGYRFVRFINDTDNSNMVNIKPHKLKIQICTYCNERLAVISQEEIYFNINPGQELSKFQFYHNMISTTVMKKIGNILLSFSYKMEEMKINLGETDEQYQKYVGLFYVSNSDLPIYLYNRTVTS